MKFRIFCLLLVFGLYSEFSIAQRKMETSLLYVKVSTEESNPYRERVEYCQQEYVAWIITNKLVRLEAESRRISLTIINRKFNNSWVGVTEDNKHYLVSLFTPRKKEGLIILRPIRYPSAQFIPEEKIFTFSANAKDVCP